MKIGSNVLVKTIDESNMNFSLARSEHIDFCGEVTAISMSCNKASAFFVVFEEGSNWYLPNELELMS